MAECNLGPGWIQLPEGRWCYDTIDALEGGSSLHHHFDNPQEGCDYLIFRHDKLNTADPFSVSFRIRHAYAPSNMNNWQLTLGAEFYADGNVPRILSGLVLGVNYLGSDDLVKIWRVDDESCEVLCPTSFSYQEQVGTEGAPLFRVDGNGAGRLELYVSLDPDAEEPVFLGSCRMEGMSWGRQLVLRYRYTSSRDRALWLDDLVLEGQFEKDTLAPFVTAAEFLNERWLSLEFSEPVMKPDPDSFHLSSEGKPEGFPSDSVRVIGQVVDISFPEVIPNREPHHLRIKGLADKDGNLLLDTVVEVMRNEAQWGDLVFNEIMADPDPAVRFREEYMELFNRSDYNIHLEGWQLMVNERTYLLNALIEEQESKKLEPGGFLLLKGLTLPNEGAVLSIHDRKGQQVHAASYRVPWDGPQWKKEGGWALESPDADLICRISVNWEFSNDPGGGTPGRINSNAGSRMDREPPLYLFAGLGEPGELLLHYAEPLRLPADSITAIRLDPGAVHPEMLQLTDPLGEILQVRFQEDFQDLFSYRLRVSGLSDCAGNQADVHQIVAGAVSPPGAASVVINEIMYDPLEEFPEYVELFLSGDQVLDLQDLSIHLVEEGGSPDNPIVLSTRSRLVLPGQYLVLTACVPHLMDAYGLELSGHWVEVEGLTGLHNSSGIIYLTDRAGNVVDRVEYSDDMHMELLDDPRGISLERVSVKRPGSDADNWHSAASISGYATPGTKNSQSVGESDSDRLLDVEPEVFSPDNDGYQDLLEIKISTDGPGWVIGLLITDLHGNQIRVLANNHLAGPSLTYNWDGEGENGSMQPMGFYVIHARGYHPATGKQWIRRRAVGLVYR
ncbi:MAG: lamin tail domain-containing protein [Bacteroidota bacterium]|nr:lamin tail domain-containing protein [Bacteroidota bacterium]